MVVVSKFYTYTLFAVLFLASCVTNKQALKENPFSELNTVEQKRVQFDYLFHEATSLYMLRLFSKSESYLKEALKYNSESGTVHYLLSTIYVQKSALDSAFLHAQKAASLQPDNEYIVLHLARLYYQNNELDKAIELYDQLLGINPQRDSYYKDLATIYTHVQQLDLAADTYDKYEAIFGITEEISLRKNQLYTQMLDPTSAYNELKKLIDSDPFNARYYGIMAEYLIDNQQFDDALSFYNTALKLEPANGMINLSLADFYLQQNNITLSFNHLMVAIDDMEMELQTKLEFVYNALNLSQKNAFNRNQLQLIFQKLDALYPTNFEILLVQADFYIDIREYRLAADRLVKSLDNDKSNYNVWEKLLQLDFELQDFAALLKHSTQAMQYFPNQPYLYLFAGLASENLNNQQQAVEYYQMGADITVDNPRLKAQFYLSLADFFNRANEYAMSDEYFERVLALDPNNTIALNNYSYYLSNRKEKIDKALKMSQKAIMLEPRNPTFLDTRAWVLFQNANYSEALQIIELAMKNGGQSNTEIIDHYARILLKNGMKKQAILQWKMLLKLDPSRTDIAQELKLLE